MVLITSDDIGRYKYLRNQNRGNFEPFPIFKSDLRLMRKLQRPPENKVCGRQILINVRTSIGLIPSPLDTGYGDVYIVNDISYNKCTKSSIEQTP